MPLILPMAGVTPIVYEQVEKPEGTPTPLNVSGCWVTLVGQGGIGAVGGSVSNENQNTTGGGGGGGGAVIDRVFIPAALLGTTYSLVKGTTSSRFAQFVCGGITLSAGWGFNAAGRLAGTGGTAASVGIDVPLANGGPGADGGTNNDAASGPAPDVTNGAAAGGGGGGGARSSVSGGKAGSLGGSATGPLGKGGGPGQNGRRSGNGANGGNGGCGGGYTAGTQTVPGIAYVRLEWV